MSIEGVDVAPDALVASGWISAGVAMVHRDGLMIRVPFVVHGLRADLELQWPPKLPPAFTYVAGSSRYGGIQPQTVSTREWPT